MDLEQVALSTARQVVKHLTPDKTGSLPVPKNVWIHSPQTVDDGESVMSVYVRRATRYLPIGGKLSRVESLDIAFISILSEYRDKHVFSTFMAHVIEAAAKLGLCVYIENVHSSKIHVYCNRYKWTTDRGVPTSYYMLPEDYHSERTSCVEEH